MLIIDQMNRLLPDDSQTPLIVYDMAKYVFALALRYQGQLDASLAIQLAMEKRYLQLNLRSARASNLYDLSLAFTDQPIDQVQKNQRMIAGYLLEAIRLGLEIGDRKLVAMNQYGLSFLRSKLGQYDDAVNFARKAATYFDTATDEDWQSRAQTRLASTLIDAGSHEESFKHLDRAEKFTSRSNNTRLADIEEFRYKAHRKLGHTKEALESLEKYMTLYKQYTKERTNKNFNQTAVKLGLQYQEERNKALARQNELQAEQINLLKKFRLVSIIAATLFLIVCGALFIVWRQASAIRFSRLQMKEVLDHVEEGIVILDRQLLVRSGYSSYLDTLFARPTNSLQEASLLEFLFPIGSPDHDKGAMVRDILSTCIDEEALNWELNHAHLPHEVNLRNLILQLHWQPLYNSQKQIANYLVSIRDITSLRAIERKMNEESQRVELLQEELGEVLKGNTGLIRNLLRDLEKAWPDLTTQVFAPDQQAAALRRLHTWKGAARTLGLKHLATAIHHMESGLVNSADAPSILEGQWHALTKSFQDYQHLLNAVLVGARAGDEGATHLYAYAPLYAREMNERLDGVGRPREGVMVLDNVQGWNREILARIHEMLLHAVSNALDHGFIRPLQKRPRSTPALIQIKASHVGEGIELMVKDNGAGIDWKQLQRKAEEKGFRPQPGQSLTDLLFMDGVTTAESTTETSGRGVGLSAIRSICSELNGQITLGNAEEGGTALRITLPL